MAQPGLEYRPTDAHRAHVKALAMCGRTQEDIALSLGIHHETLTIHFSDELKTNVMFLEATASARMFEAMKSDDERVATDAAKFLLRMKCKWKEDKSIDSDVGLTLLDALLETRAAQLLAKKEKEHDC